MTDRKKDRLSPKSHRRFHGQRRRRCRHFHHFQESVRQRTQEMYTIFAGCLQCTDFCDTWHHGVVHWYICYCFDVRQTHRRLPCDQGCSTRRHSSTVLFVLAVDWTMRRALTPEIIAECGICVTQRRSSSYPGYYLADLDFADDIALLSRNMSTAQKIQL